MSVDGSYGRLSAHKQRMDDFRRKKDRQRKKSQVFRLKSKNKLNFDKVHHEKLYAIKKSIQKKAKTKRNKEYAVLAISILIMGIILYYTFRNVLFISYLIGY